MKNRIKALRKRLGVNQQEFGQELGVAPTTVSTWECTGKLPEDKIVSICRTFNVNESWLRDGGDDKPMLNEPPSAPKSERETMTRWLLDHFEYFPQNLQDDLLEFAQKLIERTESRKKT